MAKSAFLRYLPARLKPFGNPAVWAPLTVFTLLSVFLWEWRRNPEWFNRTTPTTISAASDLSAEDRARLSEMGNLEALVEGTRLSEDTEAVTGQINPGTPILPEGEESEATLPAGETDGFENPFTQYEEEYQFGGAANSAATASIIPDGATIPSGGVNSASGNRSGSTFNFGSGLVNPAAPGTNSALSEALTRQLAIEAGQGNTSVPTQSTRRSTSNDPEGTTSASDGGTSSIDRTGNSSSPNGADSGARTAVPSGVRPAGGNIPQTFIPTTPNMSPPVGTTGYQAPASSSLPTFNQPLQQPTQNPLNGVRNRTQPSSQGIPTPNTRATPIPNGSTQSDTLYTAPSFTQPDQGRAINPRR